MKKLTGWQKAGVFAGVGCLSIIAMGAITFAVAVFWARSTLAELGDSTPTRVERTIPVSESAGAGPEAVPDATPAKTTNEPLRLEIDLEEGSFDIRPGPPGGQVRIEGTYAEGQYDLTQTRTDKRTTIRFRAKAPMWARILGGIGGIGAERSSRPNITVLIPQGLPMDLSLRVGVGESRIDLGGLALRELGLDLEMGNHEVDFTKPGADEMRRLRLTARMGNVSVENLGNARAKTIDTSGSMGNVQADLGGAWQPGSETALSFTHSMGEVRLRVPRNVRLDADVRNEQRPGDNPRVDGDETSDPKAPLLHLRVSTSMGESRIRRY